MTFLLVPGPEALLTVPTSDRVGQAMYQDQVFPQVRPAGETFIALLARFGFLHFKLSQTLRVILLSVLDQSSLGDETFPTVSAGKVPSLGLLSHVDLQVVRFVEHFPTGPQDQNDFPLMFVLIFPSHFASHFATCFLN